MFHCSNIFKFVLLIAAAQAIPSHVTNCGGGWFSKTSSPNVNAADICMEMGFGEIDQYGGNSGNMCSQSNDRNGNCCWDCGDSCGTTIDFHCSGSYNGGGNNYNGAATLPSHVTDCGGAWFSKTASPNVNAQEICASYGYGGIDQYGGNSGNLCSNSNDRNGNCCWDCGDSCGTTIDFHCSGQLANQGCSNPTAAHGGTESVTRYQSDYVNAPSSCVSQTRTRSCSQGNWGNYDGSYQYETCYVYSMCGSTQHNGQISRVRYMDPEVNAPYSCRSETQYSTCNDGSFGVWSGSEYAYESCVVRAMCEDVENGQSGYQTMYENAVVDYPLSCVSEQQSRLCTDGSFASWSGSYSNSECSINYDIDCVVEISECTAACEAASERSVSVITAQNGQGAACADPTDCQNRDGACLSEAPTASPTNCPTPDTGGGIIDVAASEVMPNGRVILDFRYSYVVSEFALAMNTDIYSYSAATPNDWNVDSDTCYGFINREFTYNQLQQSVDFTVENGDVYFAVDSSFEYTTMQYTEIDGVTHEWGQTVAREKDLPFKLHVPETTTLTLGVTSNQEDPNPDDFIYPPVKSKSPTTSEPTKTPTVSQPTEVPSEVPTVSEPTEMPSISDPTGSPVTSEPTNMPTSSPTDAPTFTQPSVSPSFTSPSLSPIPDANVLATIIAAVAEETRQLGSNPLVDVTYTTVIKMPWSLTNPVAQGNAIAENPTYNEVSSGSCDTFTDIPAFLQSAGFYCQTWHLQFGGDKRCTTEARTVSVAYDATEPRGETEAVNFSWEFDLGFSSAFDCSEDLGSFQIAITVEGSSGGNANFESPGEAYLDDWYYFRIGASSGAPITEINIVDLNILTGQGEPLCEDCENIEALQIGVSDYSPDNFVVQMILDSSVFGGQLSTKMDFTFEITMSAERRRRLKFEDRQVKETVTLYLAPSENPIKGGTGAPTAYGKGFIPTLKPVEAVKQAAAKDLSSVTNNVEGSNGSTIMFVAIGGVFLLALALAGGYYMRSKESTGDVVDFGNKETELSVSRGGEDLVEIS